MATNNLQRASSTTAASPLAAFSANAKNGLAEVHMNSVLFVNHALLNQYRCLLIGQFGFGFATALPDGYFEIHKIGGRVGRLIPWLVDQLVMRTTHKNEVFETVYLFCR